MTSFARRPSARQDPSASRLPARRPLAERTLFDATTAGVDARSAGPRRPVRRRDNEEACNDTLLMLDVETVPDPVLMPADWTSDRFPKAPWHQIVAISVVEVGVERDAATGFETYALRSCRSGGEPGWDEARLLRAFWRLFEGGRYRLVTWNGRAFDMPVVLARSLMHGLAAPSWFLRGTRWANYGQRHAQEWHLDLMDAISSFGASPRLTLEEASAAFGAPGKMGEHGSCVGDLVARGEIGRVRAYCETDVANLYVVYLRWAHLTGRTDAAGHDAAIEALLLYLEREGAARPHLAAFAREWARIGRRVPMRVGRPAEAAEAATDAGADPTDRQSLLGA
jgi:3'-5' exonuclease